MCIEQLEVQEKNGCCRKKTFFDVSNTRSAGQWCLYCCHKHLFHPCSSDGYHFTHLLEDLDVLTIVFSILICTPCQPSSSMQQFVCQIQSSSKTDKGCLRSSVLRLFTPYLFFLCVCCCRMRAVRYIIVHHAKAAAGN